MGLSTVEIWCTFVPCLQQARMLFPASVALLCARGQMINFSSPTSHMLTCSLKDLYRAYIKESLVNIHIVL